MSAIIHACNLIEFDLKNGKHITIVSDSHYAILCATSYGKKNKTIEWKKEIPNKELVKILYDLQDYPRKMLYKAVIDKNRTNFKSVKVGSTITKI